MDSMGQKTPVPSDPEPKCRTAKQIKTPILAGYQNGYGWLEKSCLKKLRLVDYPIIYRIFEYPKCSISSINSVIEKNKIPECMLSHEFCTKSWCFNICWRFLKIGDSAHWLIAKQSLDMEWQEQMGCQFSIIFLSAPGFFQCFARSQRCELQSFIPRCMNPQMCEKWTQPWRLSQPK